MSIPFHFPSTIGVFGPSQVGKTTFVLKLIKNATDMFTKKPERVLYCYGAWQKAYDELSKLQHVIMHEGVPTRSEMDEFTYDRKPTLLVIDD
jgi:GTPase SAR1 family protein